MDAVISAVAAMTDLVISNWLADGPAVRSGLELGGFIPGTSMEKMGLEPTTSALRTRRSPS